MQLVLGASRLQPATTATSMKSGARFSTVSGVAQMLRRPGTAALTAPLRSAAAPSQGKRLCTLAAAATDKSSAPSPPPLLTGERKEYNRQFQRPVFDFERWKTHRSSSRYLRHVLGMRDSKIILGLAPPLFYVMTLTTAVAVYGTLAQDGVVPALPDLKFASAPFGLTSFALSLLLVFRTNTSYQRWDEARKMWGSMVNRSRDFTRQTLGYVPESQPELRSMLVRWSAAYPRALMCHLRPNENIAEEVQDILKPEEVKALVASTHRPNYCMQVLTACLKAAQLPAAVTSNSDATGCVPAGAAYRMDENLTVYSDVTGGCERILRTPIPLSYTRHTSRFMMIWLTLLPFTLWDSCRWAALPITFIVSFLLLGIEEIGVSIEEPFTILPLEVIARTIETNLRELEATHGPATLGKAPEGALNATELLHAVIPSSAPGSAPLRDSSSAPAEEAQAAEEPVLVAANGAPAADTKDPIIAQIYDILSGQRKD